MCVRPFLQCHTSPVEVLQSSVLVMVGNCACSVTITLMYYFAIVLSFSGPITNEVEMVGAFVLIDT